VTANIIIIIIIIIIIAKLFTKIDYKYLYLFHTTLACKHINMAAVRNLKGVPGLAELQYPVKKKKKQYEYRIDMMVWKSVELKTFL